MKRTFQRAQSGFTLVELAIVIGVIGFVFSAIWTAASMAYQNHHITKAATEVLTIVQNFKAIYGLSPIPDPNGEDMTIYAINMGLIPSDMVDEDNTAYALGPWQGSQVNVYSGSEWNAVTIAFWNIDASTCLQLSDRIIVGGTFPDTGLVWAGINDAHRTLPPFGSDEPFTASDAAAACATSGTNNINVQVTYTLN